MGMVSHSTAMAEGPPEAFGSYLVEEAFLGMKPTQKKAEPRDGQSETKTY